MFAPHDRRAHRGAAIRAFILSTLGATVTSLASAQTPGSGLTFQLPAVTVSALKESANAQKIPVAVTAVTGQMIQEAGLDTVSDAGIYAPNVYFTEFTARKLSNARFRGIGASPANPAITTYVDGVPQLNANTSNITLLDVDQIEFVRGPQSALFGRNTLGGVINVSTHRPALGGDWSGHLVVPLASRHERGIRGVASGPVIGDRLGAGVAVSYLTRDGFTRNVLTDHDLDSRAAFAAKGQLLWKPTAAFETRVIVSGERARDGDYALRDLADLHGSAPFDTARDFEGFTERDILSTALLTRWDGVRLSISTATGIVTWRTEDTTDLDYSAFPLATRRNLEESRQFTQEVRVASPATAPVTLSDAITLGWQAGVLLFTQNYDQDATNTYSPFLLAQRGIPVDVPISETSPRAELDDIGIGVYGQGTFTIAKRLDLVAGLRVDHEKRDALLRSFTSPPVMGEATLDADRRFSDVSPQLAVAYRARPDRTVYGLVSRGYKAGGFNPTSPMGSETFGEEHTWNLEGGLKALWANERIATNASIFRIDWQALQLNLPNALVPGQFFIATAGGATSAGAELEVKARALPWLDVFGAFGYTRARFDDGVTIGATNVGGNDIPNTPDVMTTVGAQVTNQLRSGMMLYGRAETSVHGAFSYDEANTTGQDAYALASFRAGIRVGLIFVETWVRNAFDTTYIPVGFPYALASSGFIGERGRPRTFGVNFGIGI